METISPDVVIDRSVISRLVIKTACFYIHFTGKRSDYKDVIELLLMLNLVPEIPISGKRT